MPYEGGIRIHGPHSEGWQDYGGSTTLGPYGSYEDKDIAAIKEYFPEAYEQSMAGAQGVLWGEDVGTGLASDPIEGNVERRRQAVDKAFRHWGPGGPAGNDVSSDPWKRQVVNLGALTGGPATMTEKGPAAKLFESGVPLHHLQEQTAPQGKDLRRNRSALIVAPLPEAQQVDRGGDYSSGGLHAIRVPEDAAASTIVHEMGHAQHIGGHRGSNFGAHLTATSGAKQSPILEGVADAYMDRYTTALNPTQFEAHVKNLTEDVSDVAKTGYSTKFAAWNEQDQDLYGMVRAHVRSTGEMPDVDFNRFRSVGGPSQRELARGASSTAEVVGGTPEALQKYATKPTSEQLRDRGIVGDYGEYVPPDQPRLPGLG